MVVFFGSPAYSPIQSNQQELLMSLGILSDPTLPFPILLDTVRHAETGHLSLNQARNARSRAGAIGPYQFLERFLPEFGYGMPANIPVADVQDPARARNSPASTSPATRYIMTSPRRCRSWLPTTWGHRLLRSGSLDGENIDELPLETQQYITRAAEYLTQNQQPNTEEPQMANNTLFGLPFDAKPGGCAVEHGRPRQSYGHGDHGTDTA